MLSSIQIECEMVRFDVHPQTPTVKYPPVDNALIVPLAGVGCIKKMKTPFFQQLFVWLLCHSMYLLFSPTVKMSATFISCLHSDTCVGFVYDCLVCVSLDCLQLHSELQIILPAFFTINTLLFHRIC